MSFPLGGQTFVQAAINDAIANLPMAAAQPFFSALNGSGQLSIPVAAANTKHVIATLQAPTGSQNSLSRITPSDTNNIIVQADVLADASGIVVGGLYW